MAEKKPITWITKNGKHIPIYDEPSADEKKKEREIAGNEAEGAEKNRDTKYEETGIPSTMPTKQQLLDVVKKLKGKDLNDAISRLDSLGSYYREDKRQKRGYLQQVINNIYKDDPAVNYYPDGADNYELIEVVYGVSRHSEDFSKRFGRYDVDKLYDRARKMGSR